MKKAYILSIIMLLVLSNFVSAAVETSWYKNDWLDSGLGGNHLLNRTSGMSLNTSVAKVYNASLKIATTTDYARNLTGTGISTGNHNFSVAFWARVNSSVSSGTFFVFGTHSWDKTNNGSVFGWQNGKSDFSIVGQHAEFTSAVNTETWYHYVYIYNTVGSNATLYKDGVLIGNYTFNPTPQFSNTKYVGVGDVLGLTGFSVVNTYLNDIRVYDNQTLSVSEISILYNGGVGTSDSLNFVPVVLVNAPVNGSSFFVGNHDYFDVNVSSSGFGGNVTTQVNLYNSTDSLLFTYFSQSNPYIFNITNLSIGTYKINATSNNYTQLNISDSINNFNIISNVTRIIKNPFNNSNNILYRNSSLFSQTAIRNSLIGFNLSKDFNISLDVVSFSGIVNASNSGRFLAIGTTVDNFIMQISSSGLVACIAVNTTGSSLSADFTNISLINNYFKVTCHYNSLQKNLSIYYNDVLMETVFISNIRNNESLQNLRLFNSYSSQGSWYNGGIDNIILNNNTGIYLNYNFENVTGLFGFENSSTTTTASIYNSTSGSILTPVNGYNSSTRYLNLSWSNATFNPVFVSVTNTTLYLLNNDLTINRTIYNFTNGISINNYTYDLYSQNLTIGSYYVRLDQVDVNGNGRTTSNIINITTNTLLNITAKTITGASIDNFTINAYNSLYAYNKTSSTTNAYLEMDQIRGNISLIIDAQGYSTNFSTANIQVNTANYSYQFTLYETNTFNITFYNQANPTVLLTGVNISLDLISNLYAQNYTTNNGTLYIPLLVPETYTIRYYSNGFTTRFYYFTLNNRSYEEIKLYLINSTASYNFTVYVVNQVLNPVEGAVVKNLKYDLATNSYLVQEIGTTDVAGKTTFTVTYNNEFYKQIVEYPSGTFKKMTNPDYIDTPSVVIPISLGDNNIVEEVINYDGINGILVFNNVTDNFRFDWSDTGLVASQYCVNVYRMTGLAKTLYNNSCGVGSSAGTILLGVGNGSGYVYYAEATYFENSIEKYLTSLYYTYPTPDADEPLGNKYGLFIQLILTLGMTSLVVLNIGLAMILAPFSLIIGKILGWNAFTWAGLLALQVVGIILAIISSMRR